MAELAKKLHFLKNGTEQTAKIYTTTNEVGTNYISVKVDGTTGYVPINDISHGNSTIGRVTKGGSTYAILSRFAQILSYVGTATDLSEARGGLAATSVGNYALFGGGWIDIGYPEYKNTVDAYDTSLTRTIPTALSEARDGLAATSVGNYALFGGGGNRVYADGYMYFVGTATVDAYDTSLTRTIPTPLSEARSTLAATTVGNYALFGGGDDNDGSYIATVDAYDTSLTRTIPTPLSEARSTLAATTVGNYALFADGYDTGMPKNIVDAYDTSLTRTIPTPLSEGRSELAATTVGDYALFGGGGNMGTGIATVDAYDTSLTRTIPTPLSEARYGLSATSVGDYALFGGSGSTVDAYDTSLTRTIPTPLSEARYGLSATSVGICALFGGGGSGYTVDAYAVS